MSPAEDSSEASGAEADAGVQRGQRSWSVVSLPIPGPRVFQCTHGKYSVTPPPLPPRDQKLWGADGTSGTGTSLVRMCWVSDGKWGTPSLFPLPLVMDKPVCPLHPPSRPTCSRHWRRGTCVLWLRVPASTPSNHAFIPLTNMYRSHTLELPGSGLPMENELE